MMQRDPEQLDLTSDDLIALVLLACTAMTSVALTSTSLEVRDCILPAGAAAFTLLLIWSSGLRHPSVRRKFIQIAFGLGGLSPLPFMAASSMARGQADLGLGLWLLWALGCACAVPFNWKVASSARAELARQRER